MDSKTQAYCRVCARAVPVDSTERCFDCVGTAHTRIAMESRDKCSMWAIRDIEAKANSAETEAKDAETGLSIRFTQFYDTDFTSPTFGMKQGCAIEIIGEPPHYTANVPEWKRKAYVKNAHK